MIKTCGVCSKIIYQDNKSGLCKECFWKNKPQKDTKCVFCGKVFTTKSYRHKYCSSVCQQKYWYEKQRTKTRDRSCYLCGSKENIDEHHIQMQKYHGNKIMLLCEKCHTLLHKFYKFLESEGYIIEKIL